MSRSLACSHWLTGTLTRIIITVTAASLAAAVAACGGGDEEPSVRLLLEADLSELPATASTDEAMTTLVQILESRALAFGAADVEIEREEDSRVSVTLPGMISEEDARLLMVRTALLELRQPVLDEEGAIVCQSPDAALFSVARDEITYTPAAPGGRPSPRCLGAQGQSGEIVWEPVAGGQDQTQEAGPVTLQVLSAAVDRTREPVLLISLTPDGTELLQATSEALIGLPLGFFLDGDLLAGPTIQEPLTTGGVPIAGLSVNEANILAAQLNAGPLPVPVEAISIQGPSE